MTCPQCGFDNPEDLVECQECAALLVDIFSPQVSASEAATTSGRLAPNTLLGNRYEVLELIGEGGMGFVYKVRDRELDKVIALKLIRSEQAAEPTTVQRFKQELLLARKITHKNVVRIYDFGEADGLKFFTMEWIDGKNLKQRIRSQGKMPVEEAQPMIHQMLEALQEAHRQGVVHRDLKPQNTMVDGEGEPHILDFGIARAVDTNTMTATGAILGTPDYMSPEQAQGEKADEQSDLFSFGVILYEMLTGELPYQAESPLSRVVMRVTHKPTPPGELNVELPRYLEKIVLKCLETDRELRYKSAGDVLRDLERERVDRRALALSVKKAAGRRKPVLAAAPAFVLAAGLAFYFAGDREPSPPVPEQEDPVTTLAIVPFTNATGSTELDWMRSGLADMLITDISQSRYLRPVPGDRVLKLLRELGVEEQTRFDQATLQSLSDMAPAESVLYGQFTESEGRMRLDLALRSAGTGVPTPIKVEGDSSRIFSLVDRITQQVKEQLDLSPDQLKGDSDRPVAEVSTDSLEALRDYQAGLAQMRQGANQAAIPLLQKATAADASFAMAQAKLAEAYLNIGEYNEAEAVVDRMQSLSESAPLPLAERYQVHAIAALAKDDYETAVKSYRELANLYVEDPDIQLSLAQSLERLGQWPEALKAYRRVLELAPGNGAALLGLSWINVTIGNREEAIRSLNEALDSKKFQNDLEALGMAHSVLGIAYRDTGRLDEAVKHLSLSLGFRRKAGDKRGQASSLMNLAAVYKQRGKADDALDAEHEAVFLSREIGNRAVESTALLRMGLTYKAVGNLEQALESIRQSMRIEMDRQDHSELAIRLDWIADINIILGQYDDAMAYIEQAKKHIAASGDQEEEAYNLHNTGLVKKALGQYEDASEALLSAIPIFREINQPMGVSGLQLTLSDIYSDQGRYADAYRALRQSLEIIEELELGIGRDLAEVRARMGHLLISVGQFDTAEKELIEAQDVAEKAHAGDLTPLILLDQAELLRLRGRTEEAIRSIQSAETEASRRRQKELSIRARIALGRIYLQQRKIAEAEKALLQTKEEASNARLCTQKADAAAALAGLYLAKGDAQAARTMARQAIGLAERFSGRPLLCKAYATLGEACERLDLAEEALNSYSKIAEMLNWIRGSLLEQHIDSYRHRPDVEALLKRTAELLKKSGRNYEAESLESWIASSHGS